jgi:hypothetical protein
VVIVIDIYILFIGYTIDVYLGIIIVCNLYGFTFEVINSVDAII